ncbi:MAG: helix-turn-helix domain-containing protein [Actinomycetota bacterium]
MSPADWIRIRRLNRLRERIHDEPSRRISELAFELGFTNMGNMAGSYRRLFNERPSETAARARAG